MKKTVRKTIAIILTLVLTGTVSAAAAQAIGSENPENDAVEIASGFCGRQGENIEWSYFDNGELVLSGSGEMKDYTWDNPTPWNAYTDSITKATVSEGITNIGNCAFAWTWLMKNVDIADSVTEIGDYAFYNGGLTEVDLPDNLTVIGNGAFNSCEFTEIDIPSTVTAIGEGTFYYCDLESVIIPDSITEIGKEAFAACFDLKAATLSKNIRILGQSVFASCYALESINIPDGVTELGRWCFFNCRSLAQATVPATVTVIGEGAFKDCAVLKTVNYKGAENQWNKVRIGADNAPLAAAQVSSGSAQPAEKEPIEQIITVKDIFVKSVFALLELVLGIRI